MGLIGSTFAYFEDIETSEGNVFQAGTLDLKMRDPNTGQWVDGVQAWTLTGWIPGESTAYADFDLREVGTLTANDLEIGCFCTASEGDPYGEGTPDTVDTSSVPYSFAKYVEITELLYKNDLWQIGYDGTNWYVTHVGPSPPYQAGYEIGDWVVEDSDGVPGVSLADLHNDPLKSLPPPDGTLWTEFMIWLAFRSDAGNDLQGDTLYVTIMFTLNQ